MYNQRHYQRTNHELLSGQSFVTKLSLKLKMHYKRYNEGKNDKLLTESYCTILSLMP